MMRTGRGSVWRGGSQLVVAVLVCAALACHGRQSQDVTLWGGDTTSVAPRRVAVTTWDTIASFGGPGDESLVDLWLLATAPDRVYVFDNADQRLHAFDGALRHLWSYGRKGSGPGEFQMVRSLSIGRAGDVVLLDVGLRRITAVTRAGELAYTFRLHGAVEQAVAIDSGRFVIFDPTSDSDVLAIADSGDHHRTPVPFPWKAFARLDRLVRSGALLQANAANWTFGFSNGDGWFAYSGRVQHPFTGKYIEHTVFPIVVERSDGRFLMRRQYSAQSLSLADSTLGVLFSGMSADQYRIIDEYRVNDGKYVRSLVLPRRVNGISASNADYYVVFNNPEAMILRLRPHQQPLENGDSTRKVGDSKRN